MRPTALHAIAAAVLVAAGCATPVPLPPWGQPAQPPTPTQPAPAQPIPAPPAPTQPAQPPAQPQDPRLAALAADPLICAGATQCAEYWQRAQAWVSRHSSMAIVTINDSLIETLAPNGAGKLGFVVVREAADGGRSRIQIATLCHGGCSIEVRVNATQAFRRYVRASM